MSEIVRVKQIKATISESLYNVLVEKEVFIDFDNWLQRAIVLQLKEDRLWKTED